MGREGDGVREGDEDGVREVKKARVREASASEKAGQIK